MTEWCKNLSCSGRSAKTVRHHLLSLFLEKQVLRCNTEHDEVLWIMSMLWVDRFLDTHTVLVYVSSHMNPQKLKNVWKQHFLLMQWGKKSMIRFWTMFKGRNFNFCHDVGAAETHQGTYHGFIYSLWGQYLPGWLTFFYQPHPIS